MAEQPVIFSTSQMRDQDLHNDICVHCRHKLQFFRNNECTVSIDNRYLGHSSPISGCTCCHHNMYNTQKVGNFRMDFNPYELYTQTYTQKYSCLNPENSKKIRQKIVRMHKTCLTSQFIRLSLTRFFRESKHAISQENLANKSLRNCDVRQVCFAILTIFCRFKPKNVCTFPKFSSFQLFQSEIIHTE